MNIEKPQDKFTFVQKPTPNFSVSEYVKLGSEIPRGDKRFIMSRSALMEFAVCPSRWLRGYHEGDNDATDWGSLVDCLVTCPEAFKDQYAITPETYPAPESARKDTPMVDKPWNWNAGFCRDWKKEREAKGIRCIKPKEWDDAREAAARIAGDAELMRFIECSKKQVFTLVKYIDPDSKIEVMIKCLLDLVPDPTSNFGKSLGDLKTANNAGKRAWSRHVHQFNYDAQAALFMDCYNCASGLNYTEFRHLISESMEPYECGRRILSVEFLQLGRAKYQRALADYCFSIKTGIYPTYDDGWSVTEPELWMLPINPDDR